MCRAIFPGLGMHTILRECIFSAVVASRIKSTMHVYWTHVVVITA